MASHGEIRIKRNYRMKVEKDVFVTMRDGVQVALKIYRPDAPGTFPALFAASPYQYETDDIPHSTLFLWREVGPVEWYVCEHGYAYVHLDVRGTGHSQGDYDHLGPVEQQDLYETIEWIARQAWCDGNVGGIGQSYYAWTQWWMGIVNPPSLRCIAPYDGSVDMYRDVAYHGGIYCDFLTWWYNMVRANNQHRAANLPAGKIMWPDFAGEYIRHPTYDEFWKLRCAYERIPQIKVPLLSIGHWGKMGLHLRGNILGYEAATGPKKLIVTGARDVLEAHDFFDQIWYHRDWLLPFYDRYLKGRKNGYDKLPATRIFVRGPDKYREEPEWPLPRAKTVAFHLSKTKSRSVTSLNDGSLTRAKPLPNGGNTKFAYPVPGWTFGPNKYTARGPDPIALVNTFTSEPLAEDLEVVGPIVLELYAASTNIDTEFIVKLSDQNAQSEADRKAGLQPTYRIVSKGWLRASHRAKDQARSTQHRPFYTHADPQPIEPGRIYKFEIEMMPCGHVFKAGNRIRLEICNADSPITDSLFVHQYMWYKVGTDTFMHNEANPSRLLLPVVPMGT
jgi:hypothetical protein